MTDRPVPLIVLEYIDSLNILYNKSKVLLVTNGFMFLVHGKKTYRIHFDQDLKQYDLWPTGDV